MTLHIPVLLKEAINSLNLENGDTVVDATLGGGGHSLEILQRIGKSGRLVAIDADAGAIERFGKKLEKESVELENVILVNDNFRNLESILKKLEIEKVDAILADIGYSSDQLEDNSRGISFQFSAPLDMRFDQNQKLTARKIVNEYSRKDLEKILREYGEEKFYKNIVKGIVEYRSEKAIENTDELVEIIKNHVPDKYKKGKISPATKTFQALRIEVNDELSGLQEFVSSAMKALKKNGRLAVISFHSLEDRIVKNIFRENARGCICPRDFPLCRCGNVQKIKIITKKPITPGGDEIENNPRSRSAKMRICEFIG